MWNRTTLAPGLAVAALALVSACADVEPTRPDGPDPAADGLFRADARPVTEFHGTLDAAFVRIAEDLPGFGGFYYDASGDLNVVMSSMDQASLSEVASVLSDHLPEMRIGESVLNRMRLRAGEYDFVQLNAMHHSVRPVLGLAGTVFTDADEARNRVVVGVESATAAAAVQQHLAMLDLPAGAVIIEQTPPIRTEQSLRDRVRPVAGGLQINFPGFLCTHGFNVRSPAASDVHGFVTNSHCSVTRSAMTDDPYWQPSGSQPSPADPNFIGNEAFDLPFSTGGDCPAGRVCRWSDALGARYAEGVENAFGAIYRTQSAGTGLNPGSLQIDPNNPRWQIVGELPFPIVGQVLHKTGRTNGWTMGPVNATCQTVSTSPNITLYCQDRVTTWSSGGDSGSPYYERVGETNEVRLAGLHWGSNGAGNTVMSSMNNIRCENEGPAAWITYPGQTPPTTPMCAR